MALLVWQTLKEAIHAYTGLSPVVFFALALAFAVCEVVSGWFASPFDDVRRHQRARSSAAEEEPPIPQPVQVSEIREEERKQYDGSDPQKPLLITIKRQIYDVTQSRLVKTKKLRQYSDKQKILLVGEGDFSFSLSLARAFGSATNLMATSLDTREELELKYGNGKANVEELPRLGCTVVHGVNVHYMRLASPRSELFDRIIFNFPHSGFGFGGCEHHSYYIVLHQEVVRGFLKSAEKMVKDKGGEIHITHKTAHPFSEWKIETLAEESGLCLVRKKKFYKRHFPGYSNKKGNGPSCDSSFPVGKCSTFIFQKRLITRSFA